MLSERSDRERLFRSVRGGGESLAIDTSKHEGRMRNHTDFHVVHPQHRDIDAELRNWARWIKPGRGGSGMHPMFRYYRSSDVHESAPLNVEPIRPMDAMRMEKAISAMPERNRISLQWCYYYCHQGASIALACRALDVDSQGLMDLIHAARQLASTHKASQR